MKKLSALIIAILCLFGSAVTFSYADNPLSGWKYYKSINLQGNNKYKAVYLDNQVYKHALSSLSDIRIVDNNNDFVSYYIKHGYSHTTQTDFTYDTQQIRRYKEKNDTIYDFKVLPQYGEQKDIIGSSLQFNISEEFLKETAVYGSHDGITWHSITRNKIYIVEKVQKLGIPLNGDYRYKFYRVRILNDIENIQLLDVKLKYNAVSNLYSNYTKTEGIDHSIKNEGKNTSVYLNNSDRLKIKTIRLSIDGHFNRRYEIYVKSGDTFTNTGISGNIYSLKFKDLSAANTDIDFGFSPISSELIQVKIINLDDRPLEIKGIETQCYIDKLVFEAKPDISYRLFFANTSAEKPSYDMESYREHIELENQDICTLSEARSNPSADSDRPQTDTIPDMTNIFNALIVVLSLGLIALVVTKLRLKKKDNN